MKVGIFLLAAVTVAVAVPSHINRFQWNQFKLAHNKVYNPQEERIRYKVFSENLKKIEEHNVLHDAGLRTYKKGVNKFADMTEEEFKNYLTLSGPIPARNHSLGLHKTPVHVTLPESIDYRTKNAVNPVKDQGHCGSCWAFSTVSALESINYLHNGELLSFSEQNLVDCSTGYDNHGCRGGLMDNGFRYIKDHGLELEVDYPYTALNGECKFDKSRSVITVSGYKDVESGNEDDLKSAVATAGPTCVAVDASEFQFYHSGIFTASNRYYSLNHGIVAVGYGTENGQDYWLVRNSWGPNWGEKGYIRIARNDGNQIGISDVASYPVL